MECFEFGYVIKGDVNDTLKKTVEYCSDGIKQKAKVLAGYIVSTVRNTAINRLRVKEYEKDHIAEFTEENVSGADRYVPMETLLILAERRKALLDIWPVLPKETQILLKGKYILGYTDQELACQLKCKPSSIRMKLTRARRAALLLLSERNEVKEHDKT